VTASGTAAFTASASGAPSPTVQWQFSSDDGVTWQDATGTYSTSATYAFTAWSPESGYEYRAVFTNSVGSATTNAVTLTVKPTVSGNWSGYVDSGGTFTAVSGDWTVPAVTCAAGENAYSSAWIGIDGDPSSTVEQDGTESDCLNGTPSYDAWYEMYGDSAVNNGSEVELSTTTYPVSPGDAMSASVSVADGTWTLEIADSTQGWNFSTAIASPSPAPAQSSAEWIVERPEICLVRCSLTSLADFGTVTFTDAMTTEGGTSGPLAAFSAAAIEMESGSTVLALPGSLDPTGENFTDTWKAI
jgi:hypothetical protein